MRLGNIALLAIPASPVKSHLAIDHVPHVASFAEELHHFLASPCLLCPTGFRIGILFQPTNFASIEHEVHFPQLARRGQPNGGNAPRLQ